MTWCICGWPGFHCGWFVVTASLDGSLGNPVRHMARPDSAARSTTNGDLQHCSVLYNCAVFVVQRHRTHMFVALVWAGGCEGEWCRMISFSQSRVLFKMVLWCRDYRLRWGATVVFIFVAGVFRCESP